MTTPDVRKELSGHGLSHVGWLRAGPCTGRCRYRHEPGHYHAYIEPDIERFAVYAFIIGDQIVKFGKAGSQNSTLRDRMKGTVGSGNEAWLFAEGRPVSDAGWQHRKLDKFKQEIPAVIRAQQEIEVWAGAFSASTFEDKERELNRTYNPPWVDRDG
jgi:hypothetical protein